MTYLLHSDSRIAEEHVTYVPAGGAVIVRMPVGTPEHKLRDIAEKTAELVGREIKVTVLAADEVKVGRQEWAVFHPGTRGILSQSFATLLQADVERLHCDENCATCKSRHALMRRDVLPWEDVTDPVRDAMDRLRDEIPAALKHVSGLICQPGTAS